jgi:hypothetical protein
MTERGYLKPPEEIDMAGAERAIRRSLAMTLVALACAVAIARFVLPGLFDFPEELPGRLAFAARASVFVLLCVAAGILLVSNARRFSPADIGGSAAGPPSERVAIYAAFLQNTLEQAVITIGLYFALATVVSGPWLSLIVVSVPFFVAGRVLFLRGYARGVEGRTLGMALTMLPTLLGYLLVLILLAAGTTTSSSAPARPAACSRTGCRRIRTSACCCSRPAARTTTSGSTSRSAICTPSATRAPTGATDRARPRAERAQHRLRARQGCSAAARRSTR